MCLWKSDVDAKQGATKSFPCYCKGCTSTPRHFWSSHRVRCHQASRDTYTHTPLFYTVLFCSINMYILIYIHTHIYLYIYTHTYTYTHMDPVGRNWYPVFKRMKLFLWGGKKKNPSLFWTDSSLLQSTERKLKLLSVPKHVWLAEEKVKFREKCRVEVVEGKRENKGRDSS